MIPPEYLIVYFVSLGVCSLSTIYKAVSTRNLFCRQLLGNLFWSLVPVVNTFKALLWVLTLLLERWRRRRAG